MTNARKKKRPNRKRLAPSSTSFLARITNDPSSFPADIDRRSSFARRFRDLTRSYASDLGGIDALSEGQRALLRRAVAIQLQLEMIESKWAAQEDCLARPLSLEQYGRASAQLRRLVQTLGLERGPAVIDVTSRIVEQFHRDEAAR